MRSVRWVGVCLASVLLSAVAIAGPLKLEVKEAEAGDHLQQHAVYFTLTAQSARAFWEFLQAKYK